MNATGKQIIVHETAGIPRSGEIVRVAVPCARGEFPVGRQVAVFTPEGEVLSCQSKMLKQWPDGSVKWYLLDFPASVAGGKTAGYFLVVEGNGPIAGSSIAVRKSDDLWRVDTGKAVFNIDARMFNPFSAVSIGGADVLRHAASCCRLELEDQMQLDARIDELSLEETGPLRAVVRLAGRFSEKTRFFCRLYFQTGSSAVKVEFTLRNAAAARHRGGLWDLGDEGSLLFRNLAFSFAANCAGGDTSCILSPGATPLTISGNSFFSLYQESSGGENWCSPVHRNREGHVPMQRCGYIAEQDGRKCSSGVRATPLVWHGQGQAGMAIAVPRFWQEFPGEITIRDGILSFSPFPARFPDLHELQGGEQKTCEFWIDFATEREELAGVLSPLLAHAAPDVYRESGVCLDLPGDNDVVDRFTSPSGLLAKREAVDEYGWRNFGDIHADHEAVFHKGEDIFVSHYNNQYDFSAGLYRKFFATGDPGWRELAADLARHVRDIDLYHTGKDREEYNHGLFWHTDHYIDAGLSTHRSFSREHLQTKDPRFCGGGPGAEHCYTTGLLLHYFQTGNPDFRQAVLDLAEWELTALGGPRTVLAALKRGAGYFSLWRASRGKRKLFPRYPLTRGTGNAISACIDAFEVGGGRRFLDEAERLVRGAIHPNDDISCRDLLNAEIAWSYTVLLVSVVKFLDKKIELGEFDGGFVHARASLIAYASWMLDNEYPYLNKPEILEYPNETWAAQDFRKSVILYHAARFTSSEKREVFLERSRFFFDSAWEELGKHETSSFTRPVALMLQNGWVGARLNDGGAEIYAAPHAVAAISGRPTPVLTLGAVVKRIASDVGQSVGDFSLQRELAWLRARLP